MIVPRVPDFIGIGAQKAGTSWLRAQLLQHPDVWMPPLNELHYFDQKLEDGDLPPLLVSERLNNTLHKAQSLDLFKKSVKHGNVNEIAWWAMHEFLDRDEDWYRRLFSLAPSTALVGEITPRYAICDTLRIAEMHRIAPDAKLLFILRHPVERFWSQCKMKHEHGTLANGDPPAMQLFDTSNGRPRGEYSATLTSFCQYYDPSQILIIFYDGIVHEPQVVMQSVFTFLGLAPRTFSDNVLKKRVNSASVSSPMPTTLRDRITAAYRSEMETLAEVFGGYAATWLETSPISTQPVIQLNTSHIEAISARPERVRATRTRDPIKIFCLSMQRSGTTSVGDWLESHGLKRAGSPTSVRLGWTRLWLEGKFEEIYSTPEFQAAEILEDDPWWCPRFYYNLAKRFPEARFVLLTRDPDEWFDSLCYHSCGMNPGWSDIHARIYDREAELHSILQKMPSTNPASSSLLSIIEHREHYKGIYQRHIDDVKLAFAETPNRLFLGELNNSQCFHELCDFVGVKRKLEISIPRSNAHTEEMYRKLSLRLAPTEV